MDRFSYLRLIAFIFCVPVLFYVHTTDANEAPLDSQRSILNYPRSPSLIDARQNQPIRCGFSGNSDIYGLGIRIGYYTQSFAVWFASYFVYTEVDNLRATSILFVFAMFLALILISLSSATYAVEAFLLLQLLFVVWLVAARDNSKWIGKNLNVDTGRIVVREVSKTGMIAYNVWFWWRGLDLFQPTPCGTFIWFVWKISPYGAFRSAHRVLSIMAITNQIFLAAGHAVQLMEHWRCRQVRATGYFERLARQLRAEFQFEAKESDSRVLTSLENTTRKEHSTGYVDHASSPILENDQRSGLTSGLSHQGNQMIETSNLQSRNPVRTRPTWEASQWSPIRSTPTSMDRHTQQTSHHAEEISPGKNTLKSPMPTFACLLTAEEYLTTTLSTWPLSPSYNRNLFSFSITHTSLKMRLTIPDLRIYYPRFPKPLPSLIRNPLRLSLLVPLSNHLYAQRKYPLTCYPSFFMHALSSPHHKKLNSEALTVYLILHPYIAFLDSQAPTPTTTNDTIDALSNSEPTVTLPNQTKPTIAAYYQPIGLLSTLILIISFLIALELTIYWNQVSNVSSMNTVGQLVPMILGIGGLIKVLWSFARNRYYKTYVTPEEEGAAENGDKRTCAELFVKLRSRTGAEPGDKNPRGVV